MPQKSFSEEIWTKHIVYKVTNTKHFWNKYLLHSKKYICQDQNNFWQCTAVETNLMNMENTMAGILANATMAGELAEVAEVIFLKVAMNCYSSSIFAWSETWYIFTQNLWLGGSLVTAAGALGMATCPVAEGENDVAPHLLQLLLLLGKEMSEKVADFGMNLVFASSIVLVAALTIGGVASIAKKAY